MTDDERMLLVLIGRAVARDLTGPDKARDGRLLSDLAHFTNLVAQRTRYIPLTPGAG